jgi:predicted RNA-binding protein
MCLSKVYADEMKDDAIVVPEAASLIDRGDGVEVRTLFGESRLIEGYGIREVDLMKNYVVLKRKESGR